MDRIIAERQKLIEAVNTLPDEALLELANFVDYLRYKSVNRRESGNNGANFLMAIAGLGNSAQNDVSKPISAIFESQEDSPVSEFERSDAIRRMRGLLKTQQPAPTDEDVAVMLEERRVEKYLR